MGFLRLPQYPHSLDSSHSSRLWSPLLAGIVFLQFFILWNLISRLVSWLINITGLRKTEVVLDDLYEEKLSFGKLQISKSYLFNFTASGDLVVDLLFAAKRYLLCCEYRSARPSLQWISATGLFLGWIPSAEGDSGCSEFSNRFLCFFVVLNDWIYHTCVGKVNSFFDFHLKVQKALPGSRFNSLLLNRYKGGSDYVGWHSDDEKLYGPTPEIASISFGSERVFFLKKKPNKSSQGRSARLFPINMSKFHF